MKEQLPAPEFNSRQYDRPNQKWICGKACEGKECRIGPDSHGGCRAAYECQPVLELKTGETKGRYRCTRTEESGGPCPSGPLPDGICCRAVPKCVPVRSLRARRKRFTLAVMAFTAAVLLVGLCGPLRARFANPGDLSAQHSTETFARLAGGNANQENGCAACHQNAHAGPSGWLKGAMSAVPGPLDIRGLATVEPPGMSAIDQGCQHCHTSHSFHEPNVVREHSCSACHREHQGAGPIAPPTDVNCLSCHANAGVMQASFEQGKRHSPAEFDFRPELGRVLFKSPRPEQGYTKVIHSFATDHPEFQVLAEKLKDPDQLKFNHQLHLTSPEIVPLKGQKLECADCHKADAAGRYHLKITFEESCQSCHSLQFDVNNPELLIPHGNAQHVRDFLRSLPAQYADLAVRKKGITEQREVNTFVQRQMEQIRSAAGSGELLEQRVFFSDNRTAPTVRIGNSSGYGPARQPGCAYCHEVTASGSEVPMITRPYVPDRWLIRGSFDHGKHFKVACVVCHAAESSHDTADILLPSKQICATCHSPQGGVANSCSTCHTYHSMKKETLAEKSKH